MVLDVVCVIAIAFAIVAFVALVAGIVIDVYLRTK